MCAGERYNCYGTHLLLQDDDGVVWSVPQRWTDVIAPEPELAIGEKRALFRVNDLLELARIVAVLVTRRSDEARNDV